VFLKVVLLFTSGAVCLKHKECSECFPAEMQSSSWKLLPRVFIISALQEITHIVRDISIWQILKNKILFHKRTK